MASGELGIDNNGVQIESGAIYSASTVHAAVETTTTADKKVTSDSTIDSIISILNLGIGVLTFLITPLIMLAGWLLSPDWTFGEIFGLRPILHQLWILISNVVYVIFGFMLVFVAFANIFGGEHSKAYEMKTMLPKLVTGMLMVPFTWFIVSAVLSVSNILTASVISLPMETILKSDGNKSGLLTDKIIPKEIVFNKNSSGTGTVDSNGDALSDAEKNAVDANGESTTAYQKNGNFYASDCDDDENQCLSIKEFLTNGGGGAYNLLSVYAYGIFRIQDYKEITLEEKVNKVIDIAMKLWFGVIFFVVFGILVIAIVYALFSRAIMLWLYAMFSPFFALNYVLGDKAKKLEKFTIHEFISLALVPVYVSAALAFGLMFLGLVMGATNTGSTGAPWKLTWDTVSITPGEADTTTFKFWTNDNSISLKTVGLLDSKTKEGMSGALDIGKGVIGTIIMNVLALVILWMAVMAALGSSKITEAAVAPIKWFGDEIGKLAMKAPQYVPIPLPGGKQVSMASMQQIWSMPGQALASKAASQAGQFQDGINRTFGGNIPDQSAIAKIKNKMHDGVITKDEWHEIKQEYLWLVSKNGRNAPALKELEATIIKNVKEHGNNIPSADIGGLNHKDVSDKNIAQAFMWTDRAAQDKFNRALLPNNGLVQVEHKFTVGEIKVSNPAADGTKTANVHLNLGDKSWNLEVKILKDDTLDKTKVATEIKNEYQKLHKKPLDNAEAEKLADEVIQKTKDSIPAKPSTP